MNTEPLIEIKKAENVKISEAQSMISTFLESHKCIATISVLSAKDRLCRPSDEVIDKLEVMLTEFKVEEAYIIAQSAGSERKKKRSKEKKSSVKKSKKVKEA